MSRGGDIGGATDSFASSGESITVDDSVGRDCPKATVDTDQGESLRIGALLDLTLLNDSLSALPSSARFVQGEFERGHAAYASAQQIARGRVEEGAVNGSRTRRIIAAPQTSSSQNAQSDSSATSHRTAAFAQEAQSTMDLQSVTFRPSAAKHPTNSSTLNGLAALNIHVRDLPSYRPATSFPLYPKTLQSHTEHSSNAQESNTPIHFEPFDPPGCGSFFEPRDNPLSFFVPLPPGTNVETVFEINADGHTALLD